MSSFAFCICFATRKSFFFFILSYIKKAVIIRFYEEVIILVANLYLRYATYISYVRFVQCDKFTLKIKENKAKIV